jgi:hypothetical protein
MALANSPALRAIAASIGCAVCLTMAACTVCTEQIVDETASPDHVWTTRTTIRDCGNLATPTTNIYLQRADSRAKLGEVVVLVRHTHPVHIAWDSGTQLRVDCTGCGDDVRLSRSNVHGITIRVGH